MQNVPDSMMQEWIELVMEGLKQPSKLDGQFEDIEAYSQYLRAHILKDEPTFFQRFSHGYEVLLETLKEKS